MRVSVVSTLYIEVMRARKHSSDVLNKEFVTFIILYINRMQRKS